MADHIALHGLEFFAYHGFYTEERTIGNRYGVNIEVDTDFLEAAANDKLRSTVNYENLYAIIKAEMAVSSQLLEHIAFRIIGRVFEELSNVEVVRIEISKFNPPIGGVCTRASARMERSRAEWAQQLSGTK
jgi:dihydroneopterin aldolase